ncbi:hypothetical protein [Ensifer aridi]|uniref:hypothetical protein n=1 Tax=Ensifer aridi TaxID=1708715 RepID=UPI00358F4F41
MHTRIAIATLIGLLAADISAAQERIPWDPNCSPVHGALRATWSAERFSAMIYEVRPDGTLRPHMEARFTDSAVFERSLGSERNRWIASRREGWSAWDRFGPKYSGCKLATKDGGNTGSGRRYTAKWYGFPYKADAELWLSPDAKIVSKLLRRYSGTRWEFPFPNALLVFNLDPASALEPPGIAPPD